MKSERFLRACRCEPVDCTPVWLMRQAGRYMAEYQAIRQQHSFMDVCRTPELAAEVTMQPVNRFDVDAAILFSDILVPVAAMGCPVAFGDGGPALDPPIRTAQDIARLHVPDPDEEMPFVMEAIRILRRELQGRIPLIGFCGAPFTLASYMVEGGTSRNFIELKSLMFQEPALAERLLETIVDTVAAHLNAQIRAGAQAVQLFDTWASVLTPSDLEHWAIAPTRRVIERLDRNGVPVIYFINGSAAVLERMKTTGADVIGLDWRLDIDDARKRLGDDVAVQGNLDPCALFLPPQQLTKRVHDILRRVGGKAGHVFNLGHGILPPTPVESVEVLVEAVHAYRHDTNGGER